MIETIKSKDENGDQWYFDTEPSNHMSGKMSWFIDLNQIVKRRIRFADNSVVNAKCTDKVMIQRKKGKESYISEVLYVPKMKSNLICIGQLLKKG